MTTTSHSVTSQLIIRGGQWRRAIVHRRETVQISKRNKIRDVCCCTAVTDRYPNDDDKRKARWSITAVIPVVRFIIICVINMEDLQHIRVGDSGVATCIDMGR
jgi:hypothetical protein